MWMIFLDTHSLKIHLNLNKEIQKLETQEKDLIKAIKEDKKSINKLKNIDSLESFARENYGYKKDNETIYIIEEKD
ncbi:MAG: septum formation initiator family protein [Flavobacteriaceae bacterium]|nr:septum formation initiator family protein [Flavobacteriaceae bacterium]